MMRKLYRGPFGPMAREAWVQKAKELIQAGKADTFLFILPTATLLKEVRDELLHETHGFTDLNLLAFDDIADKLVLHVNPYTKMLTNYELKRFYERLWEKAKEHIAWSGLDNPLSVDEVKHTMMTTISEMKRSGLTADQAELIASSSDYQPKHRLLARLLMDTDVELEKLSVETGYPCLTYEARLDKASQILAGKIGTIPPWLQKVDTVWVDHFTDFFPLQFQLLQQLLELNTVKKAAIYLPYEEKWYEGARSQLFSHRRSASKGDLCTLMGRTLHSLQEELRFDEVVLTNLNPMEITRIIANDWGVLENQLGYNPPCNELWNLSKTVFSQEEGDGISGEAFTMIPCASEKKEAEVIAKEIKKKLLQDKELQPSDFAIIVRDRQKIASTLHACFAVEEIPLKLRLEIKLTEVPLFQQLSSLLYLQSSNWNRDHLAKIAEGSYKTWDNPPSSSFIRWAKRRGIREGEKCWWQALERDMDLLENQRLEYSDEEDDRESKIERLQVEKGHLQQHLLWLTELKESLSWIRESATMDEYIQALEQYVQGLNLPGRLAFFLKEMDSYSLDCFQRDVECIKIVNRSLRQLWQSAKRLGELQRVVTFEQFLKEWEEQWTEERLPLSRGDVHGVACFEPASARGMSYPYVYILGCNDGVFPVKHREHWLLNDAERYHLQKNGMLTASHYQHDMEKMFFIMAMSTARKELTFSFTSPSSNESMLPSSFLEAILKKLPEDWLQQEGEKWAHALSKKPYSEDEEFISSPQEYRLWLMSKGKEEEDGHSHLFQQEWLPSSMSTLLRNTWIEHIRRFGWFSEWDGLIKNDQAVREIAQQFEAERSVFSVSQINEYMSSPLTFYFKRILKVYPMEELGLDVSPMDKGEIQHEALRKFYLQHRGRRLHYEELKELQEELAQHVREAAQKFAEGTVFEHSSLWKLETERLAKTLGKWLGMELTSRKKASRDVLPTYFELSFGMEAVGEEVDQASSPEVIQFVLTQDPLRLRGKIDRVDLDGEGNYVIFDYKSSLSRFKNYRQMTDGTYNFQLPLYLRAMQHWLGNQGVVEPKMIGGAFYSIGERDGGKKQALWDQDRKSLIGLDGKTKGHAIEEKVAEDLQVVESGLRRLREGHFYLTSSTRPNPYFADNALYRFEPIYLKHKEKGGGI